MKAVAAMRYQFGGHEMRADVRGDDDRPTDG
jgi:hypothetical protein